jgi:hypothetical protein
MFNQEQLMMNVKDYPFAQDLIIDAQGQIQQVIMALRFVLCNGRGL